MSLLNPNKLRSEVQAREVRKIKIYERILEMCYNKILTTNKQCDDCCCIFICPSVVFGLPLFNLYECIKFIMEKLVEKGFEVHLALPNNIYISWKPESEKRAQYSRDLYQLNNGDKPLALEYKSNNSIVSDKSERKLFVNKPEQKKEKNYRPINDYEQESNIIYNTDSIDLFRTKLDQLLE
jgi:hypothetical protein